MHLELDSARLKTSAQLKTEIRAHLGARQPAPMEVDSWEQSTPTYDDHDVYASSLKGKVKSKGKGCHNCGGPHFARECPEAKRGKVKGCYTCGGNHLARNCDAAANWSSGVGKGPAHFDGYLSLIHI